MATEMSRSGRFVLDGITETMIVGQIAISQPLLWLSGQQAWGFSVVGAMFGALGIISAYALARTVLPTRESAIAAGLLAICPGYLAYATSFMSDVPALAAQFFCLAAGAWSLRGPAFSTRWFALSFAIGVFGFSIREFAVAAPAAVSIAAIAADPRQIRRWILGFVAAGMCVGIHLWRSTLPGQMPPVGPGFGSVESWTLAMTNVALVVSPAALLAVLGWSGRLRGRDLAIGAAIGGGFAVAQLIQWIRYDTRPLLTIENLASRWGAPSRGYLIGGRPLLFAPEVWIFFNVLALAAVVIVVSVSAGILGAHLRPLGSLSRRLATGVGSPWGIVCLYALAVAVGLLYFGLSRPLFDRYFWPLITPLAVIFLGSSARALSVNSLRDHSYRAFGAGALTIGAFLLTVSVGFMLNSFAFDSARWAAGEWFVEKGIPADQIDAGYEWVGYHASTPFNPYNDLPRDPFYLSWWPEMTRCAIVSSDPVAPAGGTLVHEAPYQLNLVVGPSETLYLYQVNGPSCLRSS